MYGTRKLNCELTLKDGRVVFDLNGISADMWNATQHSADATKSRRWTTFNERPMSGDKFPQSTPVGDLPAKKSKP
jgi:dihydroorotase